MANEIHIFIHQKSRDRKYRDQGEFKESDHPRANNGQFGSGGGGSEKSGAGLYESKTQPAFVNEFINTHKTVAKMKEYLQGLPKEKMQKALELIKKSGHSGAGTKMVRELMEEELDSRANRGA